MKKLSLGFPGFLPLLVLVTFAVHGITLGNSFVYDDWSTVAENSFITQWKNLPRLFTQEYFSGSHELSYRPVVTLTYFLDHAFWKSWPFGYHLTNLLIHILSVVLVSVLTYTLLREDRLAFFSGLLFSLHPINTEAVCVVSYREDSLGAFFFLCSLIFYRKIVCAQGRRKIFYHLNSWLFFLLALFTKEMAVTLPLVLLLMDFTFPPCAGHVNGGTGSRGNLRQLLRSRYWGYFLLTLFYLLIRFYCLRSPEEELIDYPEGSIYLGMLTAFKVVASYFRLLLFPFNLCAERGIYPAGSFWELPVLVSVLFLGGILILIVRSLRRYPFLAFGLTWILITVLPVANLIPLGNPGAERYLYLPAVGFCFLLSRPLAGLLDFSRNSRKDFLRVLSLSGLIAIPVIYAGLTFFRNRDWKNELTICRRTIQQIPQSARFHSNLGREYLLRGEIEEAVKEFKIAIELKPTFPLPHTNLAIAYTRLGKYQEAVGEFKTALALDPDNEVALYNFGNLYIESGRYQEAVSCLRRAAEVAPYWDEAHNNLAGAYQFLGNLSAAVAEFRKAVALRPDSSRYRLNLARALEEAGQIPEARAEYERLADRKPGVWEIHTRLGSLYAREGNYPRALRELEIARSLQPEVAEIRYNLGSVYVRLGKFREAEAELRQTVILKPDYAEAYNNLGSLYFQMNLIDRAISEYQQALEINPDLKEARMNLESLLALKERVEDRGKDRSRNQETGQR